MTGWIINFKFLHLGALGAVFFSNYACALGFGEVTLHSRIGQPLSAEVPVYGSSAQEIETACFSLKPVPGSELPVISTGRTRLIRKGEEFRLQITGGQIIAEPVFMIALRASCGIELQRDFVLMPAAPLSPGENLPNLPIAAVGRVKSQKSTNALEWITHDGDTLAAITETQAPGSPARQKRLLAALQRANPTLDPEQALAEGAPINVPQRRSKRVTEPNMDSEAANTMRQADEAPHTPRPKKAIRANVLAALSIKGADRVMLGGEPNELQPGELAVAPRSEVSEMDGRMLKLETGLHTLNLQVENLSAALEVSAEAMALRRQLQAAQAQQAHQAEEIPLKAAAPVPLTDDSNRDNWLELLVSALIGGGIAGGIAHLLSRRRPPQAHDKTFVKPVNRRRKVAGKG